MGVLKIDVDSFRRGHWSASELENVSLGEIVGHWDAVQPLDSFMRFYTLLTGGRIRNENGVF